MTIDPVTLELAGRGMNVAIGTAALVFELNPNIDTEAAHGAPKPGCDCDWCRKARAAVSDGPNR